MPESDTLSVDIIPGVVGVTPHQPIFAAIPGEHIGICCHCTKMKPCILKALLEGRYYRHAIDSEISFIPD